MIRKFTADVKAAVSLIIAEDISAFREVIRKASSTVSKFIYARKDINRGNISNSDSSKQ